jgi:hypothetical protein
LKKLEKFLTAGLELNKKSKQQDYPEEPEKIVKCAYTEEQKWGFSKLIFYAQKKNRGRLWDISIVTLS